MESLSTLWEPMHTVGRVRICEEMQFNVIYHLWNRCLVKEMHVTEMQVAEL